MTVEGAGRPAVPWPLVALVVGTFVSVVGDSVASLTLILDAESTGGPWRVPLVFVAELVPPLLLAPLLGVLVDRFDVRTVWLVAVSVQAVCFGVAALVPDFYVRVALVALANVFAVASSAAAFRLTPELAGRVGTQRANSLVGGAVSLAFLAGPGLAGAAYEPLGSTVLLGANAVTFVLVAVLVRSVVRARPRGGVDVGGALWSQAGDGLRVLRASPTVWLMLGLAAGIVLTTSIEGLAGVFYLLDVTDDPAVYGLLLSLWAVGALPGALVAGSSRLAGREVDLVLWGGTAIAVALLVEGLVSNPWVIGTVFLVGGFGNGLHNVGMRSLIHRHVPAESHGRAWSYYAVLANGCVILGYLVGSPWGILPDRGLVILSGVLALAVCSYALVRTTRLRAERHAPGHQQSAA